MPQTTPPSARLTLPGLHAPVHIHRDDWGIPHIRAQTAHDAFFGQGFAHAQDRLWQMDAARRRMQGRWAQWVGQGGVAADTLARRLGAASASERDYAALGTDARAMLAAYSAGVNAYLALGLPLPPEYRLLDDTPEPWLPWHSVAVMRQRGYLMGSVWFKLWRAVALKTVGPEQISKLRYDDGGADRLCIPPGADAQRWMADLQTLAPSLQALAMLAGDDATGGGSNNWVVAPSRTAAGRALLAGDPHRAFEMPGMYAQCHLACDRFDAIGLTVPGVPAFPHFAHNGQVAWCVTHAFLDIHDLFVEHFQGAGDQLQARYREQWEPVRRRQETIAVRGAEPVVIDVIETRHGPVIAGEPEAGCALVLRSVQFIDTDRSFDCLPRMLSATTVSDLFEASRGWGLIDHNLVAADTTGRIGHLVRGIAPRRPRANGWLPVPGWSGEYDWQGDIAFDEMPRAFDPPRGYLVTANNRFVADDLSPQATYFCTDCHPPYRAARIEALLAALPAATPEDMRGIHQDVLSQTAPVFQAALQRVTPTDAREQAMRTVILGWDAQMRADSVPAAAYAALRWQLAAVLAERSGLGASARDPLLLIPPGVMPMQQLWWALPQLVRADDTGLLGGWTWSQALALALQRAAVAFDDQPWGAHHVARLIHPLAGLSPAAARLLDLPGQPVGGDNDTVMANGCTPALGLSAAYGAISRYVFDVGNWDGCRWIVVDGSAGVPGDPHRADQHALWARGELVPMLYRWEAIRAGGDCLTLEPAGPVGQ